MLCCVGLIRHYVVDAIRRWEKRVVVTDVTFDDAEHTDKNLLLVSITYRMNIGRSTGFLVYHFLRE